MRINPKQAPSLDEQMKYLTEIIATLVVDKGLAEVAGLSPEEKQFNTDTISTLRSILESLQELKQLKEKWEVF